MYGTPYCAYFHIGYTDNCYTMDCWDIDEDIDGRLSDVKWNENDMHNLIKKRDEMISQYGDALLMLSQYDYVCGHDYDDYE